MINGLCGTNKRSAGFEARDYQLGKWIESKQILNEYM
jgi:hypothetical protein